MEIRETGPNETEGGILVLRDVFPEAVATVESARHRRASLPPEARPLYLEAIEAGAVIGVGTAMRDTFSSSPSDAFTDLMVLPAHRGRGIGSALWERLHRHLAEIGAEVVRVHATDDEETTGFATRRGFRRTATSTVLVLDPATIEHRPELPDAVEIRPCAAFVADPGPVFSLDGEAFQDEPGDHDFSGMTYESWLAMTYHAPHFDLELSKVALVDGALAGATFVYADREAGRAANGGTGVRRPLRGKGLASLLKRWSLHDMTAAGIGQVFTTNDETNAPMLAINRRLGYAPYATRTTWRLDRQR